MNVARPIVVADRVRQVIASACGSNRGARAEVALIDLAYIGAEHDGGRDVDHSSQLLGDMEREENDFVRTSRRDDDY